MEQESETQLVGAIPEDVQVWRRHLIRQVLGAAALVAALVTAGASYAVMISGMWWQLPITLAACGLLLAVAFWRRMPYAVQAGALLALLYGLGIFSLLIAGQTGDGFLFLMAVPVMAILFFGRRSGAVALAVAATTVSFFGWAFVSGLLVIPSDQLTGINDLGSWLSRSLAFVVVALLLMVPLNYLLRRLVTELGRSQELAGDLEVQSASLEKVVAERTAALERRSMQLQAAARVARDASVTQEVAGLLSQVVDLVSNRFGFYHTGIFLLDAAGEYAVLRAASSEGGQRMLARGHRLRVGETGIVGHVTRWGQPRVALDVGQDAFFFDNPDLPDTRSEMALPLRVRDEIIGALDVQSTEPAAFDDEDAAVLQVLADQVAMAIANAQLFQQMQESLAAERRVYAELSRRSWQELMRSRPNLEQRYDPGGILPQGGQWRAEMSRAVQEEKPVRGQNGASTTLALPLKVRDQVIGVLDAHKPADTGRWTEEEVATLQALADQLGQALDGARLYEESQRRAAREQLVSRITSRMRETLDLETVLQTAIREMGAALGIPRIEVRLGREVPRTWGGDGSASSSAGPAEEKGNGHAGLD